MKINFIPQNIKCIVDKSKIGWVEEEKKRKGRENSEACSGDGS